MLLASYESPFQTWRLWRRRVARVRAAALRSPCGLRSRLGNEGEGSRCLLGLLRGRFAARRAPFATPCRAIARTSLNRFRIPLFASLSTEGNANEVRAMQMYRDDERLQKEVESLCDALNEVFARPNALDAALA